MYSIERDAIACRKAIVNEDSRPCSVFVELSKILSLFNPSGAFLAVDSHNCNIEDDHPIHINTYSIAFLRDIGNVQADSISSCFYPMITRINWEVRRCHPQNTSLYSDDVTMSANTDSFSSSSSSKDHADIKSIDMDNSCLVPTLQTIKSVSAQFYNYISHCVTTHELDNASLCKIVSSMTVTFSNAIANDYNVDWYMKTLTSKLSSLFFTKPAFWRTFTSWHPQVCTIMLFISGWERTMMVRSLFITWHS